MDLLNKELVAKTLYAQYASEEKMFWLLSKQSVQESSIGNNEEAKALNIERKLVHAKMQAINETRVHLGISDHQWETVSLAF